MLKEKNGRIASNDSDPGTPKAHILSALAYLAANCDSEQCQTILTLCLDLCVDCSAYEEKGSNDASIVPFVRAKEGLSAALGFLRCEANRHKMGDFETILEAASTLVDYSLIRSNRSITS